MATTLATYRRRGGGPRMALYRDYRRRRSLSDAVSDRYDRGAAYMPTLAEIADACARIRAGWSEAERLSRLGGLRPVHWTPPVVDTRILEALGG